MTGQPTAAISVIGGSGFYSVLDNVREVTVKTPYGAPSDSLFVAELDGRRGALIRIQQGVIP